MSLSLSSDCQRRRRLSVQGRILVSSFSITVKLKFLSTRVTIVFNKTVNLDETCQGRIVVPWYKKYRTAALFLVACRRPVRAVAFNPKRPSGYFVYYLPASWSSGQSFWLLIMRSRVKFLVLPWGLFLEGEDPHGDHGLGSLVEPRFKASPGTSYSCITIHLIGTT
jgi:hypothetical protein